MSEFAAAMGMKPDDLKQQLQTGEKSVIVVGADHNPDGSLDTSRALYGLMDNPESQESDPVPGSAQELMKELQRTERSFIANREKAKKEGNGAQEEMWQKNLIDTRLQKVIMDAAIRRATGKIRQSAYSQGLGKTEAQIQVDAAQLSAEEVMSVLREDILDRKGGWRELAAANPEYELPLHNVSLHREQLRVNNVVQVADNLLSYVDSRKIQREEGSS